MQARRAIFFAFGVQNLSQRVHAIGTLGSRFYGAFGQGERLIESTRFGMNDR